MKRINNLKELRAEKLRLIREIETSEERIRMDIERFKEDLNPLRAAGKIFGNAMVNNNRGLINDGVRFTIDSILSNIFLAKAGWVTRIIVPFLVKNLSSNFIAEKKPEIFKVMKSLIRKARKATNNHHHYDQSTADEMDY